MCLFCCSVTVYLYIINCLNNISNTIHKICTDKNQYIAASYLPWHYIDIFSEMV